MKRPTALTVIGWAAIWLGMLGGVAGGIGLFVESSISGAPRIEQGVSTPEDFVIRHVYALASLQLLGSILVIASGAALLRLRRWAARLIEGMAWLVLLYGIAFTTYFVYKVLWEAPPHAVAQPQQSTVLLLLFGAGFILMFYGVPLVVAIRTLRDPENRKMLV